MGVNLSTAGAGSPGATPQILQAAQLAQASKYACLATLAAATWDWIGSLSSEYRTIWKANNSPIKFLYLISRYVGLATASMIISFVRGNVKISTCDRISTAVTHKCLFWAPPCVVDAILFSLTAYKVVQLWRQSTEGTPILAFIVRDGVLNFFWVFRINLVNLICFAQVNPGIGPLVGALAVVMPTVLCCRTVLNLRPHTGLTYSDSHVTSSHWSNQKKNQSQRGSHFVSAQGHELTDQGIAGAIHVDITKATATSYEAEEGWEGKMEV